MSILSRTGLAAALSAAFAAQGLAEEAVKSTQPAKSVQLAATIHLPQFVCWASNDVGKNMALFTAPLYTAEQGGYFEDITPEGLYAYSEDHIDESGDPSNYELHERTYAHIFNDTETKTLEQTLNDFSAFDRQAIRAAIEAYQNRDKKECEAREPLVG